MVLEFLFSPLLTLPDAVAVFIFGLFVLILINICYKFLMDQDKVHGIKKEMKEINKQMKEAKKENNMERTKKLMNESMKLSSKQMHMTMKPMLASMVIVIILLPFLHANYTDVIIPQNQTNITLNKETYQISKYNNMLQINNKQCEIPCRLQLNEDKWDVSQTENKIKFQDIVVLLPITLPFFGDDFGWLMWYLVVSIPFMIIIRKLMGIKI